MATRWANVIEATSRTVQSEVNPNNGEWGGDLRNNASGAGKTLPTTSRGGAGGGGPVHSFRFPGRSLILPSMLFDYRCGESVAAFSVDDPGIFVRFRRWRSAN